MDRMRGPIRVFHLGLVDQQHTLLDHHRSTQDDLSGMEILQVFHQHDIRPAARSNHPNFATDAKMLGGVDGGHLDGCHRSQA